MAQFVLVAAGCYHLAEAFGASCPAFNLLRQYAPIISFLMLIWPAYILVGIEKPVGVTPYRKLSHGGENESNTIRNSGDTER
ncbi:MAG: hypothetical protein WCJ02_17350 [bacterium]